MRIALVQLTSSDDPEANLAETQKLIASAGDVDLILTPEVTNCVSADRGRQNAVLALEADDKTLAALRNQARELGVSILIGSLALKTGDPDGRFANRSFLITSDGEIAARYDKIHMFDVSLGSGETYCESAGYRPGDRAVLADCGSAKLGMTICYDVRFPALFRTLAHRGAQIITVPSAFAMETGKAHWETLLRARAIETGAFIVAPAQVGVHNARTGRQRQTYGHSMVISPWGTVLLDAGTEPGVYKTDLTLELVADARHRVGAHNFDRTYLKPPCKTKRTT